MSQDSYPPDILLLISNDLDAVSKKQLCLVSRHFHSIFAPIVLQNVRILFSQENGSTPESIDVRLQTCSSNLSNLYKYAQALRVNTNGRSVSQYVTPELLPALWQTIARMTSLKSLKLEWDRYNDDFDETVLEYQEHILKSVLDATGDQLTRLVLIPDPESRSLPASLPQIRGLKFLQVICDEYGQTCNRYFDPDDGLDLACCCRHLWMKTVIKPLIAANPELETLEIKQGCRHQGLDTDDILPASLTNLSSLTISGLDIPSIRNDGAPLVNPSPLKNLRHLTVYTPYGDLKINAFWEAMKAAQPPLETFLSIHISSSMFYYLSSFSGLRSLEIQRLNKQQGSANSELASAFLQHVLPSHAESLERLQINYAKGIDAISGWDVDPTTWSPALSHLSRLKSLSLPQAIPTDTSDPLMISLRQLTLS